jgi:hypothetical protein
VEATPLATVTNKPDRRGEHEVTVKTIARGMPGDPGVTVVTMLVCFLLFTHEAAGASSARHSLRPLIGRVRNFKAKLARNARRDCEIVSGRHCEERSDEAIHSSYTWRDGLLRFARNDGLKLLAGLFEI